MKKQGGGVLIVSFDLTAGRMLRINGAGIISTGGRGRVLKLTPELGGLQGRVLSERLFRRDLRGWRGMELFKRILRGFLRGKSGYLRGKSGWRRVISTSSRASVHHETKLLPGTVFVGACFVCNKGMPEG